MFNFTCVPTIPTNIICNSNSRKESKVIMLINFLFRGGEEATELGPLMPSLFILLEEQRLLLLARDPFLSLNQMHVKG